MKLQVIERRRDEREAPAPFEVVDETGNVLGAAWTRELALRFAASEDLLAACEVALATAEGLEEFYDGERGTEARCALAAAIAKARGES